MKSNPNGFHLVSAIAVGDVMLSEDAAPPTADGQVQSRQILLTPSLTHFGRYSVLARVCVCVCVLVVGGVRACACSSSRGG